MISVGMSVSTYILLAVGSGLRYSVFPLSIARRVSSGTPTSDCFALLITSFNALFALILLPDTSINASFSPRFNLVLIVSTSSWVMPYAGNSSVWNNPFTPIFFPCSENSVPNLRPG